MRVAAQRFFPGDDLTYLFKDDFAFSQISQGKNALAVYAGASGLNAARIWGGYFLKNAHGLTF